LYWSLPIEGEMQPNRGASVSIALKVLPALLLLLLALLGKLESCACFDNNQPDPRTAEPVRPCERYDEAYFELCSHCCRRLQMSASKWTYFKGKCHCRRPE